MRNVHSYRYIDAKISNFIQRKLATVGNIADNASRRAANSSGIYYEAMAIPKPGRGIK